MFPASALSGLLYSLSQVRSCHVRQVARVGLCPPVCQRCATLGASSTAIPQKYGTYPCRLVCLFCCRKNAQVQGVVLADFHYLLTFLPSQSSNPPSDGSQFTVRVTLDLHSKPPKLTTPTPQP